MRPLYEINKDLEQLLSNVDEETGELLIDPEALDALMMERMEKIEGIALMTKNIAAEVNAIKAEEDALKERRERLQKKKEGLTRYLEEALAGDKFETAKVSITYRKSKAVEIDEEVFFRDPASMFLRIEKPKPDKKAITDVLKQGGVVPGAALVERTTMSIK